MSHSISVPLFINPTVRPGLDALSLWLEQNHYSRHARERILAHTAREGTPTGSAYLEASDEAGATGAYLRALPAVPYDDPAWDDESVILDAEMLALGTHPWPIPTRPEDDDDRTEPDGDADRSVPSVGLIPPVLEDLAAALPPISGGGFDDEPAPYEPTAEDLEDYRRWSERLDALEDARRAEDARNPMFGYE